MNGKIIINEKVIFSPTENKLTPIGQRGTEVILHAPVSRLLNFLILHRGGVVKQGEIFEEVWEKHGQRVTSNALYQNISLLRKSIKKAGILTTVIRTYPKAGFSFNGNVEILDEELNAQEDHLLLVPLNNEKKKEILENELLTKSAPPTESNSTITVNKTSKQRSIGNILSISVLSVTLVAAATILLFHFTRSNDFVQTRTIIARINSCPLYVDNANANIDFSKIIDYLTITIPPCKADSYIYILKHPILKKIVVMLCDSSYEDVNCHILVKIPDYLAPKG